MAVPVFSCSSGTWTVKKRDHNRIQAAEIKYLKPVKSFTRTDQLRNEDIINLLGFFSLYEQLQNVETNGKYICEGWNRFAFHFKPMNIVGRVG
jgi:hypothetical protein